MKLLLLTRPTFFVEEHLLLNAMFEAGLDYLHIHKPGSEPIYCERLLKLIDKRWRKQIVTHEHFYMKEEYKLKGIHLSQRNLAVPKGYKGQVSCSCQTFDEVVRRKSNCDYLFLSQLFTGITNPSLSPSFSATELSEASRRGIIDEKVMAFGGISLDNIDQLKDYNFGGCVIYGDIWKRFDFHLSSSYKGVISYFEKLRQKTT